MEFCSQMKQCCTQKKSYLNNSLGKIAFFSKTPLKKSPNLLHYCTYSIKIFFCNKKRQPCFGGKTAIFGRSNSIQ